MYQKVLANVNIKSNTTFYERINGALHVREIKTRTARLSDKAGELVTLDTCTTNLYILALVPKLSQRSFITKSVCSYEV